MPLRNPLQAQTLQRVERRARANPRATASASLRESNLLLTRKNANDLSEEHAMVIFFGVMVLDAGVDKVGRVDVLPE